MMTEKTRPAARFGPWELDRETLVLRIGGVRKPTRDSDGAAYEVDLEECLDSAEVLDWIMQVAQKSWATDAVIAGLVRGLAECLDPQANLCSGGKNKVLSTAKVRKLIEQVR